MNKFEQEILMSYPSTTIMAGTDEAGRGCLAGPLVVSAVILPPNYLNDQIKDSKKLTLKQRNKLAAEIIAIAISYTIEVISVSIVENLNPKQAIDNLTVKPDLILTDAEKLASTYDYQAIIKGDSLSQTIAAASILAKVTRDNLILEFDQKYPQYDFKNNKGYGTKKHLLALQKHGVTPLHRKTYRPVQEVILKNNANHK